MHRCPQFLDMQKLYVLFSKSQRVHALFEDVQKSEGLRHIRSLKRLNTVRWNSREMCIRTFVERHKYIILTLEMIQNDSTFDNKQRSEAAGLLVSINTKQFLAIPCSSFAKYLHTRDHALSRYLQTVNIDFSKALTMIECVSSSLELMRQKAEDVIRIMEDATVGFDDIEWRMTRVRRNTQKEHISHTPETESPKQVWKRCTFYVVIDTILQSFRSRFQDSKPLFQMLSVFSPVNFTVLQTSFNTVQDLQGHLKSFCEKYNLDLLRCAEELFNFARVYTDFLASCPSLISDQKEESDDEFGDLVDDSGDNEICEETDEAAVDDTILEEKRKGSSFSEVLGILCNPKFHLTDACIL